MDANTKIIVSCLLIFFVGVAVGLVLYHVNRKRQPKQKPEEARKQVAEYFYSPRSPEIDQWGSVVTPAPDYRRRSTEVPPFKPFSDFERGNFEWKDGPNTEVTFVPDDEGRYYVARQEENWIAEAEKKIKAAKEDPLCQGVIIIRKRQCGRKLLFDRLDAQESEKELRPEETKDDNL